MEDKLYNELEELKTKCINQILYLTQLKDRIWKYHPENPNFINPITQYNSIRESIKLINKEIEGIDNRINHIKYRS
jgi:hypothetical protein